MNLVNILPALFIVSLLSSGQDTFSQSFPNKDIPAACNCDINFYGIHLDVSDSSTYLQGFTDIGLTITGTLTDRLRFDMADKLNTDSVKVDDHPAEFTHSSNILQVTFPSAADPGTRHMVTIYYHGLGKNAGEVSGITNKINPVTDQKITWTLSESFSAMNWFPCKQSRTDKADSAYIFLSTDKDLKAGSNGLLTRTVALSDNRVRYEWKCRYPIDYYLISFSVGKYRDYSFYVHLDDLPDSLLVQNYIYASDPYFAENKAKIDKAGPLLSLYSRLFGPYPFAKEKYGHCVAPMGGGMEHQTMTTLVNFSFLLVAHEMAHQWFGDYVTCKTWQDIWMNEGFASYAEYLADQYLVSQTEADSWMARTQSYVMSLPGGSVYLPESSARDEDRIFDNRLTYSKGAAIIHMIRQEVDNDSLFFEVLRTYLHQYQNRTASGMDFKQTLEQVTRKNFDQFFDQWYVGSGYPIHTLSWYQEKDTLYVNSLQTVSSSTPFFNVKVDYRIILADHDTLISHRQESNFDTWKVYLPGKVTQLQVDPDHWLLMQVSGINPITGREASDRFTITPNPTRDRITLRFSEPVSGYTVYLSDSIGRIVYTGQSNSSKMLLNVSRFKDGLYFVIVKEKDQIYTNRFIKN